MRCEIKKGIFVLHICDAKSFVACGSCRRAVCPNHIDKSSASRIICVECAAQEYKQASTNKPSMMRKGHQFLDSFWYYSTRNNFHTSYPSYRPFTAKEHSEFEKTHENQLDQDDLNAEASSFLDS
jgi:hypothetical protein